MVSWESSLNKKNMSDPVSRNLARGWHPWDSHDRQPAFQLFRSRSHIRQVTYLRSASVWPKVTRCYKPFRGKKTKTTCASYLQVFFFTRLSILSVQKQAGCESCWNSHGAFVWPHTMAGASLVFASAFPGWEIMAIPPTEFMVSWSWLKCCDLLCWYEWFGWFMVYGALWLPKIDPNSSTGQHIGYMGI
jgi:hypothetical protein